MLDIVSDTKELSKLEYAIKAADTEDFFATQDPLTVLAPLNAAFELFADAYPKLYDVLFTEPWELHLLDFLFSHVVEGAALVADNITDGQVLGSVGGQDIAATKTDSSICFTPSLNDEACVVIADVLASNGVAHVVEGTFLCFWMTNWSREAETVHSYH